jgi:hypothetical protein
MPLRHERPHVSASAKPRRWVLRDQLPLAGERGMVTDEEYVDYARECVRLAGLTADQAIRDQLLNMARKWMAAAMHERHSAVRARRARRSL